MRILILGLTVVILKLGAPTLGIELSWLQSLVITIFAQMFAFMNTGMQGVDIAIINPKEDD